ncbi:MAG: bifunctional adenosylcobinamide kinase/adenosylcobinamide-phosphate guanylyltransferase [Alphaproteobacteria bacterium]|nr:bifunctional adenosylcobinamide kinase/adenosylcobinamide-phosphate guanylyltransferase [Alphaproteobacteria bacterium]
MPLQSRTTLLALGGARSGKTAFAEAEALALAGDKRPFYLATGQAFDAEMEDRISRHRALRQDRFNTIEEPLDIASVEKDRQAAFDDLVAAIDETEASVILVSDETGLSIVPENRMAREFRDDIGLLNQRVAAVVDRVALIVAGLPMILK